MNPAVTLIGKTIKLVPLDSKHTEDLLEILVDPRIWEFTWTKNAEIGRTWLSPAYWRKVESS